MKKMTYEQVSNIALEDIYPMYRVLLQCNLKHVKSASAEPQDLINIARFLTACSNPGRVTDIVELVLCSMSTNRIHTELRDSDMSSYSTELVISFIFEDNGEITYTCTYGSDGHFICGSAEDKLPWRKETTKLCTFCEEEFFELFD